MGDFVPVRTVFCVIQSEAKNPGSSPLPEWERIEGEGPYSARVLLRAPQDSASAAKARVRVRLLELLRYAARAPGATGLFAGRLRCSHARMRSQGQQKSREALPRPGFRRAVPAGPRAV